MADKIQIFLKNLVLKNRPQLLKHVSHQSYTSLRRQIVGFHGAVVRGCTQHLKAALRYHKVVRQPQ